ncbi:MAG: mechanosensitive ion channel domain-containing protein [Vicinamibacteria bacterium]
MNKLLTFQDIWSATLFSAGGEPVTVGAIVLAIVLIGLGYVVARTMSRMLKRLLADRVSLEPGAANAIETLAFYGLFIAFCLASLNLVKFPLTVFTLAGGAVAIGLGFGSQNVMNNFISGLILLFERPIRAGDLVSVEGTHGIVEHIGGRSTRIRAPDNTHMIVPNSYLVEHSLINFTLSDDVLRTSVAIGVAYGSPTREVERLLTQALVEHSHILKEPSPAVLFSDFGDNSLNFQTLFWIHARSILDRRRIESDLRYRIDELFAAHHIVIAFPQRDVHLDSVKPIEVKVVTDQGKADR